MPSDSRICRADSKGLDWSVTDQMNANGSTPRSCKYSSRIQSCRRCIDPPGETTLNPWLDDPFPDYDTEPVMAFSAT
jgi:hypothetical protein